MPVSELDQVLFDATAEVLETMFFTTVLGDASPEVASAPRVAARLSFRGKPSGWFGVCVPLESGRKIAASFLGLEEESLTELQIGEVVRELANMLCGSVLSRLEKETRFELSPPELDPPEAGCHGDGRTVSRALQLEEGNLAVWVELGQPL